MGKQKKSSKKNDPGQEKKPLDDRKASKEEVQENEFGGIPERDLKKNLGCGG